MERCCDKCGHVFYSDEEIFIEYPDNIRTLMCWDCHEEFKDGVYNPDYKGDEIVSLQEIDDYITDVFKNGG